MRRKHNLPAALFAAAAVTLLLAPSIVRAIVYGFVDTNNVFTIFLGELPQRHHEFLREGLCFKGERSVRA